jgi:hypothetical protein
MHKMYLHQAIMHLWNGRVQQSAEAFKFYHYVISIVLVFLEHIVY